MSFASPQSFFGAFALRHIDGRSDHFDKLSRSIEDWMPHAKNVLNSSIGQQKLVVTGALRFVAATPCALRSHSVAILRVNSLQEHFFGGPRLMRIDTKDAVEFLGAVDHLVAAWIPGPTARLA